VLGHTQVENSPASYFVDPGFNTLSWQVFLNIPQTFQANQDMTSHHILSNLFTNHLKISCYKV